ncbi:hypothetical protein P7C73_g5769, partial [Tremellales sp. Uapishka_1]
MRESNYSFPPQNRAVVSITHLLYDRRALDTNSPLAILNNLTSLTYLTSTSPRIREILTLDGGLERLLDILRESCLPQRTDQPPDVWGFNGPSTAKVIARDRQISLKHSLAFQCVVNIGVRGSEPIRTRVVQAGALDLVAQILESWLKKHGVSIFAGPLGSQAAVDAIALGQIVPGIDLQRRDRSRSGASRHNHASSTSTIRPSAIASLVANLTNGNSRSLSRPALLEAVRAEFAQLPQPRTTEREDIDMDGEADVETDGASVEPDDSMEVDDQVASRPEPRSATTPRARQEILPIAAAPIAIPIPHRPRLTATPSQDSSAGNSFSEDVEISRPNSQNSFASGSSTAAEGRPRLPQSRLPHLGNDANSNQSSPMGTPTRQDIERTRRGTIIGRPINVGLAVRNERRREAAVGSGTSDGGEDIDLPTATVEAGIMALQAAQAQNFAGVGLPPNGAIEVEVVENALDTAPEPEEARLEAEQARMDLEAGAPPGIPGQNPPPQINTTDTTTPRQPNLNPDPVGAQQQAQIIIANGAPRGFQDLGSYVGISALLNPDHNQYSEDSILLALQLLAYLSKYPHVRAAFHFPRRPMHPTFDLGTDIRTLPLPERPPKSETPNIFSLVERFTFRPSPSDPLLLRIPAEIQYWAGVIMRNACRKDEAQGGIRQCANMSCGRWETFPREFAKCRRCRKAKYCSKECQSRAWSEGHRFW